jgi:serine/threonine protein kinase
MMDKEKLAVEKQLDHLVGEVECLAGFRHPLGARLMGFGETEGQIFIATELIEGNPLVYDNYYGPSLLDYSLSSCGERRHEEAAFFLAQASLAVAGLHGTGFVHRDVKPENLLLDGRGFLRLIDFGLARRLAPQRPALTLCGTPQYMAPEVVLGQPQGFGVDWWALGVMAYELAEGRELFPCADNDSPLGLFALVKAFRPSSLKFKRASDSLQAFARALLQPSVSQRLGASAQGGQAVLSHPLFRDFSFEELVSFRMCTPLDKKALRIAKRLNL